jgi:hypothetical protein
LRATFQTLAVRLPSRTEATTIEDHAGMDYTVPLRITVEVGSAQNVIDAAKVETQREFGTSDEEWKTRDEPVITEHFGHALGILLSSDAVTGSLTGILEEPCPA